MDFDSNRSLMHLGFNMCMDLNTSGIKIRSLDMASYVVFPLSSNRSYEDS